MVRVVPRAINSARLQPQSAKRGLLPVPLVNVPVDSGVGDTGEAGWALELSQIGGRRKVEVERDRWQLLARNVQHPDQLLVALRPLERMSECVPQAVVFRIDPSSPIVALKAIARVRSLGGREHVQPVFGRAAT